MSSPYEGLQNAVDQLPEFLQPLIVAGLGAIPYVEGEGSAALGILVGINPVVAAVAGAAGNILSVVLVVFLSARVRQSVVARRARSKALAPAGAGTGSGTSGDTSYASSVADASSGADASAGTDVSAGTDASEEADGATSTRRAKGRKRLRGMLVKFGVPGASILAPWVLPTQLTAAFFVASGVAKGWVILWQVVAIVLWTGLVAAAALGVVSLLGW
ncbi:small multidrug efflux protein [Agromyces silvae]|uniref:small multidrug efflux protein n=1 Tax=Agromyces silvae TaxID=3388266 RepID=UPI00280B014F|nr:small multidrug efflux protein [Agromyces protaetiae]